MNAVLRVTSALALLVVLTACVPPTPIAREAEAVPATPTPSVEVVTLQVWDIWTAETDSQVIETIHREFEAAHPGVKINRVVKAFEDMKATAKLALSSPDGPDVAQINQGEPDMGALVKAGLLVNLTPLAEQYGWFQKISPGIVARNSFTADGKVFGEGNLYGMPPTAELVGVYYRKDIFAELGLSIPKTFAEFEAILEALKGAGYVPITFGNLDGWPAIHTYGEIQNVLLGAEGRQYLDDLIYARGNVGWDVPANVAAAAKLQEWVKRGYFTSGFEGISYDDSWSLFNNGQGAMMLTGSWMSSTFAAGPYGDKIGFFLVPPETEGGRKLSIGGTSTAYAIRVGSPHVDLAAEYIDWMMSDRAAELWLQNKTVPVQPVDPALVAPGTLFADLVSAWNLMNETDTVGHYLDWATPTFYDTITAALQELLALRITPEEFVQKLQADYATFLEEKAGR